jgi:hypothetical protein
MASSVGSSSNNPDYPPEGIQIFTREYLVELNKFSESKIVGEIVSRVEYKNTELEGQVRILFSHFIQYLSHINKRILNLEIGKKIKTVVYKENEFKTSLERFPDRKFCDDGFLILESLEKRRDIESFNLKELDREFIDAYEFGRYADSSGLKNLLDSNPVNDIKKKIILQFVLGAYKEGYDLLFYEFEDCLDENIKNLLVAIRSKTYFEVSEILKNIPNFLFTDQLEDIIISDFIDNFDELKTNEQNIFLLSLSSYGKKLVATKAGAKGRYRVLDALLEILNIRKDKIIEIFINSFCENGHIDLPNKFLHQITSEEIKKALSVKIYQARKYHPKGLISSKVRID